MRRTIMALQTLQRPLLIEPLKRVVLGVDSSVLEPAVLLVRPLLGMEAVEGGLFVLALVTKAEEDVAGPIGGQRGNLDAPKDVRAVGGRADTDLVEVVGGEAGEVGITEVGLFFL